MVNHVEHKQTASAELSDVAKGGRGIGSRIAPAVALLLLGDSAYAGTSMDSSDGEVYLVPEPSILGLMAAGVAVGGVVAYIRNKRRK